MSRMSALMLLAGLGGASFARDGIAARVAGAPVLAAGVAGWAGVALVSAKLVTVASDNATAVRASPRPRCNLGFIRASVPGF
jgi:hypothetical protein